MHEQNLERASTSSTPVATEPADREVFITRIFDAPRELVFKAWTDPEHLKHWYAPYGCTISIYELDFRPGGAIHTCIHNPEVPDCLCRGVYLDIEEPVRIVFTSHFVDEEGTFVEPADAGMEPGWPRETTVTVTFDEHGEQTRVTLHQTVSEALATRRGAYQGWIAMLDQLEKHLAQL